MTYKFNCQTQRPGSYFMRRDLSCKFPSFRGQGQLLKSLKLINSNHVKISEIETNNTWKIQC